MEIIDKYDISERVIAKFLNLMEARSANPDNPNVITDEAMGTYWHYIMAVRFNTEKK